MQSYPIPLDHSGIELPVRRWTEIIFKKELQSAISDAGILEL
jgi:hypothetical protein